MSDDEHDVTAHLVEGTVEVDSETGLCVVLAADESGEPYRFNPQDALLRLKGREVRVIVVPLDVVQRLTVKGRSDGK
jgi:hypothetical protein